MHQSAGLIVQKPIQKDAKDATTEENSLTKMPSAQPVLRSRIKRKNKQTQGNATKKTKAIVSWLVSSSEQYSTIQHVIL